MASKKLFCRESIYTLKLARLGHFIPNYLHANPRYFRPAADFMSADFGLVSTAATLGKLRGHRRENLPRRFSSWRSADQITRFVRPEVVLPLCAVAGNPRRSGEIASRHLLTVNGQSRCRSSGTNAGALRQSRVVTDNTLWLSAGTGRRLIRARASCRRTHGGFGVVREFLNQPARV